MSQRMDQFKRTPLYWVLISIAVAIGIYMGWYFRDAEWIRWLNVY